ncbi:hypothetical protein B5X24_HaOG204452 [Helicoverpa armigera]|uniref:Uncharacterized protein n=1 Tax=Helicoverpa armigera TaxID=29058 RepID=A0A2W1BXR3_HELAM|nr:hypothetical protein B5X24_HaOG204452 [Helicoverpa armigera]
MRYILVQSAVLLDILYCVTSQDLHFRPVLMMEDLHRKKITRGHVTTRAPARAGLDSYAFSNNELDDIARIVGLSKPAYSPVSTPKYRPVQTAVDSQDLVWLEALEQQNELQGQETSSTMVPMHVTTVEEQMNCVQWANCKKKVWRGGLRQGYTNHHLFKRR